MPWTTAELHIYMKVTFDELHTTISVPPCIHRGTEMVLLEVLLVIWLLIMDRAAERIGEAQKNGVAWILT